MIKQEKKIPSTTNIIIYFYYVIAYWYGCQLSYEHPLTYTTKNFRMHYCFTL